MNNNFFNFDKTLTMLELIVDDVHAKTKNVHNLLLKNINNINISKQYSNANLQKARMRALDLIATKKRLNRINLSSFSKQRLDQRSTLLNKARRRAANLLRTKQRLLSKQRLNNRSRNLARAAERAREVKFLELSRSRHCGHLFKQYPSQNFNDVSKRERIKLIHALCDKRNDCSRSHKHPYCHKKKT